jgi:DNA-binding IclR family transcriptional regulator
LQLLAQHDLVERASNGQHYRSGVEFFRLASLVMGKTDLIDIAAPILKSVVDACNEVCFLVNYVPAAKQVMVVRKEDSTHPLRYNIPLFQPDTMLWGATGRSVLAFLPPEERDAVLAEAHVSPVTGQRLPPRKQFLQELERVREAGYVCTSGQKLPGAVGIGAPVFSGNGHVIGSICITVPQARFDRKSEPMLAKLAINAAARLSTALGFRPSERARRA